MSYQSKAYHNRREVMINGFDQATGKCYVVYLDNDDETEYEVSMDEVLTVSVPKKEASIPPLDRGDRSAVSMIVMNRIGGCETNNKRQLKRLVQEGRDMLKEEFGEEFVSALATAIETIAKLCDNPGSANRKEN